MGNCQVRFLEEEDMVTCAFLLDLLNVLSGEDTAIVSEVAGTTRDIIRADIHIDGLPLHIIDTAGLHMTDNMIEQEGIRRAVSVIREADQILWVVDSTLSASLEDPLKTIALFDVAPLLWTVRRGK
jgi:tRNA modification GTPase